MKPSRALPFFVAATAGASTPGRGAVASFIANAMPEANVSGILAVAAQKSGDAITQTLPQAATHGAKWVASNPATVAACGAAGVGLALVAAPGAAAAAALGAVGFGSNGVAAGSVAAAVQSGIGNVVAPSIFAGLQSAAAGGYGAAVVLPAVQALGGTIAGSAGAAVAYVMSKSAS